jgi:hypothetical protein
MALIATLLGLLLMMTLAAGTPIGRFLHRALVELPASGLARISRGHVAVAVALLVALAGICWLIDEELALVMSLMAPEALAYLSMFEIGMLADAVVTAMLIATGIRFPRIAAFLRGIRPRARAPRARRPERPAPSNDDEDGEEYARAA